MASWDEIKESVENSGDVRTVSMEQLREAIGTARLGKHVCTKIQKRLAGMGLGHIPEALPSDQLQSVRLYKRGTPVGDMITTVLHPSEPNDKKLVELFADGDSDYAEIVQSIRELVAE